MALYVLDPHTQPHRTTPPPPPKKKIIKKDSITVRIFAIGPVVLELCAFKHFYLLKLQLYIYRWDV
jgi:hypothetical protein